MNSIKGAAALVGSLLVLPAGVAMAGDIAFFTQTLCISGVGNGTPWDYELRPAGGGVPFCSGTGSAVGPAENIAAVTVSALDGCAPGITAYVFPSLGPCAVGEVGLTITKTPPVSFELAIEQLSDPCPSPTCLKVPTPGDPVEFNPFCVPTTPAPVPLPEPGSTTLLLAGIGGLMGLRRVRKA